MCRCTIFLSIHFSVCLLMSSSVRPFQVLRKPCLIALVRFAIVGMKSAARRYCHISGLGVWTIMLFATIYYCCFYRVTYHIPVCLFLLIFIIICPLFWNDISCLSSVMLHQSSHKTPNDISEGV